MPYLTRARERAFFGGTTPALVRADGRAYQPGFLIGGVPPLDRQGLRKRLRRP